MIATIGAAVAPGVALLSFFYLKDRYETEPLQMVLKTFIFGVLMVFPIMVLQYGLQQEIQFSSLAKAFFISGFIEEFSKWFVVYYTVYKHVEFDEPYDGIVYSVAVSLGFATLENFFYLYSFGVEEALMRAFLPVSSHALFGVTMGYYMGKGKFHHHPLTQRLLLLCSFAIPAVLHGFYDYVLLISSDHYLWILVPFLGMFWAVSLWRVNKVQSQSKMPSF